MAQVTEHNGGGGRRGKFLYFIIFHNSPACAVARRGSWVAISIAPSLPRFKNDAIDIAVHRNRLVLSSFHQMEYFGGPVLKSMYFLRNSNDSGPPVCSKSIKMMNVADFLRVYLNFVEFRGIS